LIATPGYFEANAFVFRTSTKNCPGASSVPFVKAERDSVREREAGEVQRVGAGILQFQNSNSLSFVVGRPGG
jgi:hypothetical protein